MPPGKRHANAMELTCDVAISERQTPMPCVSIPTLPPASFVYRGTHSRWGGRGVGGGDLTPGLASLTRGAPAVCRGVVHTPDGIGRVRRRQNLL